MHIDLRILGRPGVSRTVVVVLVILLVAVGVVGFALYDYYASKPSSPIIVFSADLYTAESSYLYSGFSNSTGVPYAAPKAAGSFALATQIAQGSPVSVFISVSKAALEPTYLQGRAPGWGIAFAEDQM